MAEYLGRDEGNTNSVTREYPVASGVTINAGDFVYLTAGRVSNASIGGKKLLGMALGNSDPTADDGTVAVGNAGGTVKVLVNIERDARYLIDGDNVGTTLAVTHEGTYFDLTGNTGAQLVDTSTTSATAGQLILIKFNPGIRGTDNSWGVYRIAENQHNTDDIGAS